LRFCDTNTFDQSRRAAHVSPSSHQAMLFFYKARWRGGRGGYPVLTVFRSWENSDM